MIDARGARAGPLQRVLGSTGPSFSRLQQLLDLVLAPGELDTRRSTSEKIGYTIGLHCLYCFYRIEQHRTTKLLDDSLEKANAIWAQVDAASAVSQVVAPHVEKVIWRLQLLLLG